MKLVTHQNIGMELGTRLGVLDKENISDDKKNEWTYNAEDSPRLSGGRDAALTVTGQN